MEPWKQGGKYQTLEKTFNFASITLVGITFIALLLTQLTSTEAEKKAREEQAAQKAASMQKGQASSAGIQASINTNKNISRNGDSMLNQAISKLNAEEDFKLVQEINKFDDYYNVWRNDASIRKLSPQQIIKDLKLSNGQYRNVVNNAYRRLTEQGVKIQGPEVIEEFLRSNVPMGDLIKNMHGNPAAALNFDLYFGVVHGIKFMKFSDRLLKVQKVIAFLEI